MHNRTLYLYTACFFLTEAVFCVSVFSFTCGLNNEQVELVDFSPLHGSNSNPRAAAGPDRNRIVISAAPGRSSQRWQEAESSGEEDDDDEGGLRHEDLERRTAFDNQRADYGRNSSGAIAASSGALDDGEWPPRSNGAGVAGLRGIQQQAGTEESKR